MGSGARYGTCRRRSSRRRLVNRLSRAGDETGGEPMHRTPPTPPPLPVPQRVIPLKHSGLGVAATALALVTVLACAALLPGSLEGGFATFVRRTTAIGITATFCVIGIALAVAGCVSRTRRRTWAVVGLTACLLAPAWPIYHCCFAPRPRDLVAAIYRGDASEVRTLLARGVSPESVKLHTWAIGGGRTALTGAVSMKRIDLIDLVLDAGANIEAADPSGATPLLEAIVTRDPRVVAHLLDRGARLNARTANGHTPLSNAAAVSTTDVIALLIDR